MKTGWGWRVGGAALLGVCAGAGGVGAQSASAPALRVTTRLVSVDVVVEDASGHVVPGLTAGDFVLKENGREQRILSFTDETGAAARSVTAGPGRGKAQFTNHPAVRGGAAVTLILFDLMNTPTAQQPFARTQLLRFLERLPEGSACGLFVLGSHVRVLQQVTTNRATLLAAAGRLGSLPADLVRDESDRERASDQAVREASARGVSPAPASRGTLREVVISYRERASNTGEALAELTQAVAGYPGRKNLLWLAGSFPVAIGPSLQTETAVGALPQTLQLPGVHDGTGAMAASGIAIYPISTRGMASTAVGAEVSGEAEAGPDGRMGVQTIQGQVSRQFDLQVAMEHLAGETGGRAFYNTNNLAGALEESLVEGQHSYRLDYVPENKKWDGAYRKLAVSLRGGRGYHLAYRQGYFATAEAGSGGSPETSAAVRGRSLDATGVLLAANVSRRAAAGEVTVDAVIDAASVTFVTGPDGLRHARLLVLLTADGEGGTAPPEKQAVLNLGLEPADFQAVLARGIPVRQTLAGVAAGGGLRLAVRDLQTGQVGTLRLE